MKATKRILAYLVSFISLMLCPHSTIPVFANNEITATINGILYEIVDGEAYVNEIGKPDKKLTIPETITVKEKTYTVVGFKIYFRGDPPSGQLEFPETVNLPSTLTKGILVLTGGYSHGAQVEPTIENYTLLEILKGEEWNPIYSGLCNAINITPGGIYASYNGIVYSADLKTPLFVPRGKKGEIEFSEETTTVPARLCYGRGTFYNGIETVVLNYNITHIGSSAFEGCEGLKTVKVKDSKTDIPDSKDAIDSNAFKDCKKLVSVELPNYIASINSNAFNGCLALKKLTLPKYVKYIAPTAFAGCNVLNEYDVPADAKYIEVDNGMIYTKGLEKLMVVPAKTVTYVTPESTREIGKEVFKDNGYLRSVTFSEGLEVIGNNAFENCPKLSEIILPSSLTILGKEAFKINIPKYTSPDRDIYLPAQLTSIPTSCFEGNTIRTINWPEQLCKIYEYAFFNAKWSPQVNFDFPPTLTEVGKEAFNNNKTSVVRGLSFSGLRKIGSQAFKGIVPREIYCAVWTPPQCIYHSEDNLNFNKDTFVGSEIYVPSGAEEAYYSTYPWSEFIRIKGYEYVGVETVESDELAVEVQGETISVTAADGLPVEIYSTDGCRIFSGEGNCSVNPGKGMFIVRAGRTTRKVIL